MRRFEIFFCFHRWNFIKKKHLFLFSLGRAQMELKDLMSQEKLGREKEHFVRIRRGDADVQNGPTSSRKIAVFRMIVFQGKYLSKCVLSFLPRDTVHELSLSADWRSLSARPSGPVLDDTVNFSVWSRTDKLNFSSSEQHGALPLCH